MKTGPLILLLLITFTSYGQLYREQHYVSSERGIPQVRLHLYADSTFEMTIDFENCIISNPFTGR